MQSINGTKCFEDPVVQYRTIQSKNGGRLDKDEEFVLETMKKLAKEKGLLQLSQNKIVEELLKEAKAQEINIKEAEIKNALASLNALNFVDKRSGNGNKKYYSLMIFYETAKRDW
jgi:hypothetical protein